MRDADKHWKIEKSRCNPLNGDIFWKTCVNTGRQISHYGFEGVFPLWKVPTQYTGIH
jgi:hypothetical protein